MSAAATVAAAVMMMMMMLKVNEPFIILFNVLETILITKANF